MAGPSGRPSSYCKPGEDDPSLSSANVMIYSHPGEGKSILWGTLGDQVCFMVSDPEGLVSVRAIGHKPHSIQVTDYEELEEAYQWFNGSQEPRRNGIRWIVWDSVTLFQDRALLDDIMVDAVAENPRQDPDVPSRREYFQSQNRISAYTRKFVSLDYNFGMCAHVMDAPAPDGNGMVFLPLIQGGKGALSTKICGYMNVVGYLHKAPSEADKNKVVQVCEFMQMGKFHAKDRFQVLGKRMERPTGVKIDAAITQWRNKMKAEKAPATPPASQVRRTSAPAAQKVS